MENNHNKTTNILIVEDDKNINDLIKLNLNIHKFSSLQATTGVEAVNIAGKNNIELVLLDINLPDIDGFSLLKSFEDIPVIFLTARGDIGNKLKGFKLGAQDYITKPFDMDELMARINVVLQRNNLADESIQVINNLEVDLKKQTATLRGERVELTVKEFALLEAFIENKNITLSRDTQNIWGYDYLGDNRTVDVHIRRLRNKLDLKNNIKTVFKSGYRMEY